MKVKNNKTYKGFLFAGCSFTWGQGLYYYSNLSTLKEPPPDAYDSSLVKNSHNEFRKTLYFPRLVANHFNTFEVSMLQNGGSEETSFDYIRTAFGLENDNNKHLIVNRYDFDEIEYVIFQTSQPNRNTYHYEFINDNGAREMTQFRINSEDTHAKFYKYLAHQKKCIFDQWYEEHLATWFIKIKENLQFYESKGIKTLILNWENDYLPLFGSDFWMNERMVKLSYKDKDYQCIRDLMNDNRYLTINSDTDYFEETPKDHHPSKECHRIIAENIIKKIETN